MERTPTKVAIVGAGKGGIALLELLHQIPDVDITTFRVGGMEGGVSARTV